jgi:hypothetical protein
VSGKKGRKRNRDNIETSDSYGIIRAAFEITPHQQSIFRTVRSVPSMRTADSLQKLGQDSTGIRMKACLLDLGTSTTTMDQAFTNLEKTLLSSRYCHHGSSLLGWDSEDSEVWDNYSLDITGDGLCEASPGPCIGRYLLAVWRATC